MARRALVTKQNKKKKFNSHGFCVVRKEWRRKGKEREEEKNWMPSDLKKPIYLYNYICVFFDFQWKWTNRKQSTIYSIPHEHTTIHTYRDSCTYSQTYCFNFRLPHTLGTRNKMNLALIWALSMCPSLFLPLDSTLCFPLLPSSLLFSLTKFIGFELFTFFCCSCFAYLLPVFWVFFHSSRICQLHIIVRPFLVVLIMVCVFRSPSKPKNETQSHHFFFYFRTEKCNQTQKKKEKTKCNSIRATAVVQKSRWLMFVCQSNSIVQTSIHFVLLCFCFLSFLVGLCFLFFSS